MESVLLSHLFHIGTLRKWVISDMSSTLEACTEHKTSGEIRWDEMSYMNAPGQRLRAVWTGPVFSKAPSTPATCWGNMSKTTKQTVDFNKSNVAVSQSINQSIDQFICQSMYQTWNKFDSKYNTGQDTQGRSNSSLTGASPQNKNKFGNIVERISVLSTLNSVKFSAVDCRMLQLVACKLLVWKDLS